MAEHPERRHSLRKSQLIDFPNVAAGHDGVKSSQSGDLIVKPCKHQEVVFYTQWSRPHPHPSEFSYYMPKFFGTLNLQESSPSSKLSSQPQIAHISGSGTQQPQQRPETPNSTSSAHKSASHARSGSRTVISHLPVDGSLAPTKPPKKWEPRHGAKIEAENSVVLENVASGLAKPNILDIKIGARLWADDAPLDKRERLDKVASETTSGSLGFRIAGMKVWAGDGAYETRNRAAMDRGHAGADAKETVSELPTPKIREDDYASYERDYGRALTKDNVRRGFEEYFYPPESTGLQRFQAQEIIRRFVEDLRSLEIAMDRQETRMYSASLLFVYEGSGTALREDFRRENRILRERREAAERESEHSPSEDGADADWQKVDVGGIQASSQATDIHKTLQDVAGMSLGSASGIPAQLVMGGSEEDDDEDGEDDEEEDEEDKLPKIQALKVIDFAHASWTPGQGRDDNFLFGLGHVVQILEGMLEA